MKIGLSEDLTATVYNNKGKLLYTWAYEESEDEGDDWHGFVLGGVKYDFNRWYDDDRYYLALHEFDEKYEQIGGVILSTKRPNKQMWKSGSVDVDGIEDMVVNFLDNQIGGGLVSAFNFESTEYVEMNGNGANNDYIEELLENELNKYEIFYRKKGE